MSGLQALLRRDFVVFVDDSVSQFPNPNLFVK